MLFSRKFIALAMGGAAILLLMTLFTSITLAQAGVFLLMYNGFLLLLILGDWFLTPKPTGLLVQRLFEHRLSLGVSNPITLEIRNSTGVDLELTIKDEPPVNFKVSAKVLNCKVPAMAAAKISYNVEPDKRGDYTFGHVNIRYPSRMGFFIRQFKATGENTATKVYPNIMEIRKYRILAQQGHLLEGGPKPSRIIGMGTDFESLRDYQVDDEYRRINWGATARRGRLTSNQYEVDKSQNILLVLDAGRMMTGEVRGLTKLDHAINASLLLGYVGVTRDDKVGLAVFADDVKLFIPPRKGQSQLQKILGSLYNIQPDLVESDYAAACRYISTKNRKRSLICIFTDLIDEEASRRLITYVSTLTGNHLVVCITLVDSLLVQKAAQVPADSQEVYEKGVAQGVLHQRDRAISQLKNRGVVVVNVPPEELSVAAINKYLEIKNLSRL